MWGKRIKRCTLLICLSSFQVTTDSEAEFFITLHGAGDGELKVYGEAPYGHFPVDLLQSPNEKDTYIVRYTPKGVGLHKIHINFAGEPVKGSPYIVKVGNMTPLAFRISPSLPLTGTHSAEYQGDVERQNALRPQNTQLLYKCLDSSIK